MSKQLYLVDGMPATYATGKNESSDGLLAILRRQEEEKFRGSMEQAIETAKEICPEVFEHVSAHFNEGGMHLSTAKSADYVGGIICEGGLDFRYSNLEVTRLHYILNKLCVPYRGTRALARG